MKSKKNNNNILTKLLGTLIILLLAVIITFLVILSMDSEKLRNAMETVNQKVQIGYERFQNFIQEKNGNPRNVVIDDNLEFPEEEKLTEAQRYFYYQQLSDTAKKIYISIENNIERLENAEDNIPLPPSLNVEAKSMENGKEYIAKEFQNAWDAFITDKSEYFYIDSSKVCLVTKMTTKGSNTDYEFFIGKGDNDNYFIDEFSSKDEVEKALKEIEKVKKDIIKDAKGNNYEKMKYIHDWIVDNVKYDSLEHEHTSNIYGCLVNKSVVCEGYARAFKYLLDELDIPCVMVSGTAVDEDGKSERHAWNYVYIKNAWYAVDTTWDDPIIIGNGKIDDTIKYKYFLRGSKTIGADHFTIGQITKDGFDFEYPELSEEDIK